MAYILTFYQVSLIFVFGNKDKSGQVGLKHLKRSTAMHMGMSGVIVCGV